MPCSLKVEGSAFESGEDAAFEAEDDKLISSKATNGIGAVFASHKKGQACLVQEDYYALIDFVNNGIIEIVDKIENKWSRFGSMVPRKNDVCDCSFKGS
ncbi:hypothetical protein SLEP1_g24831 [Rubroshorea leprosula]|uniref:Uncharacterized protein n=1 Tax=Rubroshorea leprosula TaxID=152421 RepID=A0AAV5JRE6_9ROSI|nr:hypothetical protein SLEP1_g24831 [Rubroshorea leprosula]